MRVRVRFGVNPKATWGMLPGMLGCDEGCEERGAARGAA